MRKRLIVAGLLAAALASAQDEMGGMSSRGGGGGGRGGDMGGMMPRRQTKAEQFVDKLKLNKEQQEETQRILNAALERLGTARLEASQRRVAIAGAYIDGKPAEEIKKLTADYAQASTQVMKIEADAFGKILATLKPNQKSKCDQAFELLTAMFAQTGGGGGRGAARGARGPGR
jgi:hypothetical protein